jgi:hypothetical protein
MFYITQVKCLSSASRYCLFDRLSSAHMGKAGGEYSVD